MDEDSKRVAKKIIRDWVAMRKDRDGDAWKEKLMTEMKPSIDAGSRLLSILDRARKK